MADFKDRLRQLRKEKDLSQDELAARLDVTKMAVSGYERGVRVPRFDMIDQLADILDVDVNYRMGNSDIRKPYPRMTAEEQDRLGADLIHADITVEEMDLVNAYRRLDAYGQKLTRMAARLEKE